MGAPFLRRGILLAGAMALLPLAPAAAQQITLKVADSLPVKHFSIETTKFWMQKAEEYSNGKLKFDHFPAEQLAKARDLLDAVQNRIADVAYIPAQYFPDKAPLSTVAGIPTPEVKVTVKQIEMAYLEVGRGILFEEECKKLGIRPVRFSSTPPYDLHTTRKKIKTLDDFKGMKIRVAGNVQENAIKALGGIPVSITPPDMYTSMQRGTVDGTVFSYNSIASYKLHELVKYSTTNVNLGAFVSYYAINLEVWNKLPKDVQAAIDRAAEEAIPFDSAKVEKQSAEYAETFRKRGLDLYAIDDAELKRWGELLKPVREEWIEQMEKRGLPGRKVLDAWLAALQRARTS
ncbi:TRAP transporter substrate-binding protein [Desertibaculum subflavum]|uniref:TRAP transporter substrate-binding protein n=1 Tax=Desertibaculum subflavum TaxID=2268458 RepID=UPI000E66E6AB